MSESAWLIERKSGGAVEWFSPSISKIGDVWSWSDQHLEAVRFSRRIDAERVLVYLRLRSGLLGGYVAEHMWVDVPAALTAVRVNITVADTLDDAKEMAHAQIALAAAETEVKS